MNFDLIQIDVSPKYPVIDIFTTNLTKSTIYLRQLQEKAAEQQQILYMAFIDLSKAFDTVDRSLLWTFLRRYGCPETFVMIIQEFHDGMAGALSDSTTVYSVRIH